MLAVGSPVSVTNGTDSGVTFSAQRIGVITVDKYTYVQPKGTMHQVISYAEAGIRVGGSTAENIILDTDVAGTVTVV